MHIDWPDLAAGVSDRLRAPRAGTPDVTKSFCVIAQTPLEDQVLDATPRPLPVYDGRDYLEKHQRSI